MTKKIAVKEVLSARKVNLSFPKYPEDILMTISSLQLEKQFQNLPGRCMLDMHVLSSDRRLAYYDVKEINSTDRKVEFHFIPEGFVD